MRKTAKYSGIAACAACMLVCAGGALKSGAFFANAENFLPEGAFEMEETVSLKLNGEGGIRFRVKMAENVKQYLADNDGENAVSLHFLITEETLAENVAQYVQSGGLSAISKLEENSVAMTIEADENKLYEEDGFWWANGVVGSITADEKISAVYTGFAYISNGSQAIFASEGGKTIAEDGFAAAATKGNVYDVASQAALDAEHDYAAKIFANEAYSWFGGEKYPVYVYNNTEYAVLKQKAADFSGKTAAIRYTVTDYNAEDFSNTTVTAKTEYTVTYKDGTNIFETKQVKYGETYEYTGETPLRASTATIKYDFKEFGEAIRTENGGFEIAANFAETTIGYNATLKDGVYDFEARWANGATNAYSYTNYGVYADAAVYSVEISCADSASNSVAMKESGNLQLAGILIHQKDGKSAMFGLNQFGVVGLICDDEVPQGLGGMARRYDLGDDYRWKFAEIENTDYALNGYTAKRTITVVIYQDKVYLYSENTLIKSLALTDANYLNCFTAGGEYQFGVIARNIETAISKTTIKVAEEKYGENALEEIENNAFYHTTINATVNSNMAKSGNTFTTNITGFAATCYSFSTVQYSASAVYSVKIKNTEALTHVEYNENFAGICFTEGTIMPADKVYRDNAAGTLYACEIGFRNTGYNSLVLGRTFTPQAVSGNEGRDCLGVYGASSTASANGEVTLTVVYQNDLINVYVNETKTYSVSITDEKFSATGSVSGTTYKFNAGAKLMFGVMSFNNSSAISFEVLTELYGSAADSYIAENYAE